MPDIPTDGRAPITTEVSPYSGHPRFRCTACGKIAYATEQRARDAAGKIWSASQIPLAVYLGPHCGWYHLTTLKDANGQPLVPDTEGGE